MSGAAQQLRVSQPAVSRGVAAAEQALRVRLFDRKGTALSPTAELRELRPVLELIFQQVKVARDLGEALRFGAGRRILLATTPSFAFGIVPDAVARFRADFPAAEVAARVRDAAAIKSGILMREIDLGLIYNVRWFGPMEAVPLCETEIHCLLPEGHPLAQRDAIGPRDLEGAPLVSSGLGSAIGLELDRVFEEAGAGRREIAVATGNSFMAAGFVRAGAGLGLTDPFVLGTPMAEGLVGRPFRPRHPLIPHLVWAHGRILGVPEERFVECARAAAARWAATRGA